MEVVLKSVCNHFFTKAVDQPSESASAKAQSLSDTSHILTVIRIISEERLCCFRCANKKRKWRLRYLTSLW